MTQTRDRLRSSFAHPSHAKTSAVARRPLLALLLIFSAALRADVLNDAVNALNRRDFRGAAAIAGAQLKIDGANVALLNVLGIAHSELGDTSEAQAAFARGLSLAPSSVPLNENLGLLYFKTRQFKLARKVLSQAVNVGSTNPAVRYSLAASCLRTGEADRARVELRSLEGALSGQPDYWLERGRAELPVNAADAEKSFQHAATLAPALAEAWNGAATAAESQGAGERALSLLMEARRQNPHSVPILLHFADACIRRDLGLDAIEALEQARSLDPNNVNVLFALARANISVAQWDKARLLFLEYLKSNRTYAPALYAVAWVDEQLNRRDEAKRYLDLALAADPRYADALCDRARMEADEGDAAAASRDVQAALAVDSNHVKANLLNGDLHLRAGDVSGARSFYERALKADPHSATAHYKLSGVLNRQGEKVRAGEERTLAANLSDGEKRQSKTQLRLVLPPEKSQ